MTRRDAERFPPSRQAASRPRSCVGEQSRYARERHESSARRLMVITPQREAGCVTDLDARGTLCPMDDADAFSELYRGHGEPARAVSRGGASRPGR